MLILKQMTKRSWKPERHFIPSRMRWGARTEERQEEVALLRKQVLPALGLAAGGRNYCELTAPLLTLTRDTHLFVGRLPIFIEVEKPGFFSGIFFFFKKKVIWEVRWKILAVLVTWKVRFDWGVYLEGRNI